MIRVICDRCGKEIQAPGKTGYLAWNFRAGHGGELIGNNILEDRDYCETCMGTIFDFIDAAPEQEEHKDAGEENGAPDRKTEGGSGSSGAVPEIGQSVPEIERPVPEVAAAEHEPGPSSSTAINRKVVSKQPRKPRKNSVDIGRILALREAGWSFGKIADDMGLSKQSVCNAFHRWKNAQEEQVQE